LQHNEIERIPEGFFDEMPNLKEVYIYCNKIKEVKKFINSISKMSFKIAVYSQKQASIEEDWILI